MEKLNNEYYKKHRTFLKGLSYDYGIPLTCDIVDYEIDYKKAHHEFNQSIVDEDNLGYYGLALLSQHTENKECDYSYEKAFRKISSSIDEDDPIQLLILAMCYEWGDGVEQNSDYSLKLYQKSSSLGCVLADYFLAKAYLRGETFQKNVFYSEELLNKCIDEKFFPAYRLLAVIYGNEYKKYSVAKDFLYKSYQEGEFRSINDYVNCLTHEELDIVPTKQELTFADEHLLKYIKNHPESIVSQYSYALLLIKESEILNLPNKCVQAYKIFQNLLIINEPETRKLYDEMKDVFHEMFDYFDELVLTLVDLLDTTMDIGAESELKKIIENIKEIYKKPF